jgi:hypothetical protein
MSPSEEKSTIFPPQALSYTPITALGRIEVALVQIIVVVHRNHEAQKIKILPLAFGVRLDNITVQPVGAHLLHRLPRSLLLEVLLVRVIVVARVVRVVRVVRLARSAVLVFR